MFMEMMRIIDQDSLGELLYRLAMKPVLLDCFNFIVIQFLLLVPVRLSVRLRILTRGTSSFVFVLVTQLAEVQVRFVCLPRQSTLHLEYRACRHCVIR